jgi:hypothetical protein
MAKGFIEWEDSEEEGLVLRFKPAPGKMLDENVLLHAAAARRELLLTLKSLIDVAVKHMDERESNSQPSSTKIKVE